MENNFGNDQSFKPMISEVIKEFKAGGHFDRLRKDCSAEIVSQQSFQNLNKNIEDFVKKILSEQERLGTNVKKNDVRDMVKRKLYENQFFNNEINMSINSSIESKIESGLKPIIDSMVEKLTKEPESEGRSKSESLSFIPEHIAFTPISESKSAALNTKTTPQTSQGAVQQKISVEDFLSIDSKQTAQLQKTRKISESDKPISKPISKALDKDELKKDENIKKEEKSTKIANKALASKTNQIKKKSNVKPVLNKEIDTSTRKTSNSNENELDVDPNHEYNFDWKLDQIDSKVIDEISVSNVTTSDLSDFSDYGHDSD